LTTYVRARNGGWYESPLFMFPEGFLHFDEKGAELVLWLDDKQSQADHLKMLEVLDLVLGSNHGVVRIGPIATAKRPIPSTGNEPPTFCAAAYATLELTRRIPEPTMFGSCERRLSRVVAGAHSIDLPASPNDPYELRVSYSR